MKFKVCDCLEFGLNTVSISTGKVRLDPVEMTMALDLENHQPGNAEAEDQRDIWCVVQEINPESQQEIDLLTETEHVDKFLKWTVTVRDWRSWINQKLKLVRQLFCVWIWSFPLSARRFKRWTFYSMNS